MNKIKKLALLLAVCMVGTIGLVGCGESESSDAADVSDVQISESADVSDSSAEEEASIEGTWVISQMMGEDGSTMSFEDYSAAYGLDAASLDIKYIFDANGTVSGELAGIAVEGTYAFDGQLVSMTFDTGDYTYDYDASSDTLSYKDPTSGITSFLTRTN